ncbi:A-kinase anchor 9-like [Brachionus plicatilis]|uniref:A-kinase anchor 9-like n=1 Tax=Brachionus plicatilis TaxID=10195 RepID=A0A3M7PQM5_BRAPC|nr:A-kinase anchor 9-like [Brachionus plicatilis]
MNKLEIKNKNLQGTLEALYAKDDKYMASYRRENEERNNYIKLLQSDVQQISDEKNTLTTNNQNLLSLLSKSILISVSLDEHIAKRLNKISQNQNADFNSGTDSPKSSNHLSSTESGLHRSSGSSEIGSNEDISEEGLDTSQRIYETLANSDLTDETLIDANLKVQSSIDKVLDKLEETSKQLTESHSLQIQLAYRFEENQKMLDDYKNRCQNMESDYDERINEMQTRINNLEGLVSAYELEIRQKKTTIVNLEQNLVDTKQELANAKHVIENEKTELSNMELIRKDLEAQRSLYVNNLQDSDIKDLALPINNKLILNNSYLLDEKHELEYKLNKTSEISQQQIKDLEETVENFNEEIRNIKEKYEEQLDELKRQISAMDSQIRSNKSFIDQQMAEREQEREDYESKINELKIILNRKSTQVFDEEDNNLKEYSKNLEIKLK